jgi:hypothetical protein
MRPIGGVTEVQTYQAEDPDGYTSERMRTQRGAERMPVVSHLLRYSYHNLNRITRQIN